MEDTSFNARLAAAGSGRDRVLDAVKAAALVVVIVGHSLAWHIVDGQTGNVLQARPGLWVLTWAVQCLALFFAAGAVSNAASLDRSAGPPQWLAARLRRLLGPVLIYATLWTAVLLPLWSVFGYPVLTAGAFLSQLLWFAGVYLIIVAAVPWTVRHQGAAVLAAWLLLIALVDLARLAVWEPIGWANLVLVWGWLHQVGYRLPGLRTAPRALLLPGAAIALALALGLALLGPYSNSLVSIAGDPEASNLAPPTVVVALHGLALILLVAAAWEPLERLSRRPAVWAGIAVLGSRGLGLYLWHIPLVGIIAAASMLAGIEPAALSARWWLLHAATAVVVLAGAWLLAGAAASRVTLLDRVGGRGRSRHPALLTATAGLLVLMLSVTGFATWGTDAFLGVPMSAPVLLGLLWLVWGRRLDVSRAPQPEASAQARASLSGCS